jgi:hypothetical protein
MVYSATTSFLRSPPIFLMRTFYPRLLPVVLLLIAGQRSAVAVVAAPSEVSAPPALTLAASPSIADVGYTVNLVLTAKSWPGPMTATVSFLSPHHGFTGKMAWVPSCSCFHISVWLAKRIHPLEQAKAVATVLQGHVSFSARATFLVRGLASNGRDYAPGGKATLSAWVSDPQPDAGETEHYCAWVTTADGLGVAGFAVRFVVHMPSGAQSWSAGKTGKTGLVCTRKSIGSPRAGVTVQVDVYAGNLHAGIGFKPR